MNKRTYHFLFVGIGIVISSRVFVFRWIGLDRECHRGGGRRGEENSNRGLILKKIDRYVCMYEMKKLNKK